MESMIFKQDNRVQVPYGTYGYRRSDGSVHRGLDIDTLGEPTVHSTVGGRVKYARCVPKGAAGWGATWEWGHFVWLVADEGTDHIFAHCRAGTLCVQEGQRVAAGQPLGTMGASGNAAYDAQGEHVHYEVRKNGVAVSPVPWCGVPNRVGTTYNTGGTPAPTQKPGKDDEMYRLYRVVSANLTRETALAEFRRRLAAGERVGLDCASSDRRFRVGKVEMAKQSAVELLPHLSANTFIG